MGGGQTGQGSPVPSFLQTGQIGVGGQVSFLHSGQLGGGEQLGHSATVEPVGDVGFVAGVSVTLVSFCEDESVWDGVDGVEKNRRYIDTIAIIPAKIIQNIRVVFIITKVIKIKSKIK